MHKKTGQEEILCPVFCVLRRKKDYIEKVIAFDVENI